MVLVSNAKACTACTLVVYDDQTRCRVYMLRSVQEDHRACLLWSDCQTRVAQQAPVGILIGMTSLTRCVSFNEPQGITDRLRSYHPAAAPEPLWQAVAGKAPSDAAAGK